MARAREPDERGDGRDHARPHPPLDLAAVTGPSELGGALVVCDARGRIVAADDALHALLGYEPGTLVGRKLEKLVPSELRELHRVHRERFAREPGPGGHRGPRLFTARHRDGHAVPVDIAIANLRSGDGPLSVALVRDLSDPEAAGRQVRHLAELYAFLARALTVASRATTPDDLWASVCDVAVDHGLGTLVFVAEVCAGRAEPTVVSGPLTDAVDGLGAGLGDDHPVATALSLGSAVLVPDLGLEPAVTVDPRAGGLAASLCAVPVRSRGGAAAVLAVVSPVVSGFTDATVTVLEWLAAELGHHLDRLEERERSDADTDRRTAELVAQHQRALDAAVAAAVADALATERATVQARVVADAEVWARAVEDAVAQARAEERAANEEELRLAQAAIEHGAAALAALQERVAAERAGRKKALDTALDAARAQAWTEAEAHLRAAARAHEEALAEAVETTRTEERTAAAVRARYAEDAHQRALAKAVEEARAEERAEAEARLAAELEARRAAETDLVADPARAARIEAHAAHQDVAVQLALLALATADPADVADAVVGALGRTLGADSSVLIEAGPYEAGVVHPPEVRAAWFGDPPVAGGYQPSGHADLHELVTAQDGPLVVADLATDERTRGLSPTDEHTAGVAVLVGGEPGFHGSLSVLAPGPRVFDPDEIALVERLADIIAASFERARDHRPPPLPTPTDASPPPSTAPEPSAAGAAPGGGDALAGSVTDPLTGLPNRALLLDRIEQLLRAQGDDDPLVGVLVARVDGLTELVEAHGADGADLLLVSIADRLRRSLDAGTVVARTGPGDFAVVHATHSGIEDVTDLADRVRVALGVPHVLGGARVTATVSIGVSVRPAHDAEAAALVAEAEAAVARAAAQGRGGVELHDHDLRRQARLRLEQSNALRRAIDDDELVVVWQAALPLQRRAEVPEAPGADEVWAEALVRWRNPERGLVSPGNFIALAEGTGLIVPVGRAVLRKALAQLAAWRAQEGTHPRRISVNLSPRQLADDDLARSVAAALDEAGLEPEALMLEVTESVVTATPDDAIRRLHELRDLGVGLALDDFGTGYSSLGYLRRMPVSVLKIDQSFIRGLTTHRADWAIVRGIVEMAHGVGLTVVAEGIETADQLEHLVDLGCDRGQGYLWSSPVPAEALDELLTEWAPPGGR